MTDFKAALKKLETTLRLVEAPDLTAAELRQVLDALRVGVPPRRGILSMTVDREAELQKFLSDVEEVSSGGSKLLLINGHYGAGKSHLLAILREFALSNHLAVSLISLTHAECPIFDLLSVYRQVVQRLEVADFSRTNTVAALVERWAQSVKQYGEVDFANAFRTVARLPHEFQSVLTAYLNAARLGDVNTKMLALSWFRGEVKSVGEARALGAWLPTNENALEMLAALAQMLRFLGIGGLVLLLDEAESLSSIINVPNRTKALRNLQSLMEAGANPFCYFVYATTPDFLDTADEFVRELGKMPDMMQIAALNRNELVQLSEILRDFHIQSYPWTSVLRIRGAKWKRFAQWAIGQSESSNRLFVRSVVAALDECQANPQATLDQVAGRS